MKENHASKVNTARFNDINTGIAILKQENALLDKIIDIQCEIRASVIIREWEDFNGLMENLNTYNSQFEVMEKARAQVFSAILNHSDPHSANNNEEDSLYAAAARMPEEQRNALTDLYRELKIRVIRVRYENGALLKNLNEARAFAENFIADVIPNRRGKLYTAKGTVVASDVRSMMINKSL
ncbi:MAG: hypothetical protein LBV20_03415 [Treponema sp.]|nr:hypothetical protein [Treponema sp.]